jgi:3-oxoacyl-[acyl-carrier protein] reductase
MDLKLKNSAFAVTGAGSGFGRAITELLLLEGATVLAVTKTTAKLAELQKSYPAALLLVESDITKPESIQAILSFAHDHKLKGLVVNAGGPPALSASEASISDWDQAYKSLLRWKIQLIKEMMPDLEKHQYGRILFIESASVKQPMENLVLSTSFRLALVGYVKTLSMEVAARGITMNILAPGYHETAAIERILKRQTESSGISFSEAKEKMAQGIPVKRLGKPEEFATLALWLLSPHSGFVTGQTISVDGGAIKNIFG